MSPQDNRTFAAALEGHLIRHFNIQPWNEDAVNNHRVMVWADFYTAAVLGGPARVQERADYLMQKLGRMEEPNGKTVTALRNETRLMAATVASFCRGPQGLS